MTDQHTLKAIIDGLDEAARTMEAKWGFGRLPLLVSVETRAKFYRQRDKAYDALEECYGAKVITRDMLDRTQSACAGMERAWKALDAEATTAGAKSVDPDVWECVLQDGSVAAIVRTTAEASSVIREGRMLNVWTLDEVARAIDLMPEIVRAAKETFPGATVQPERVRGRREKLNDEIPF